MILAPSGTLADWALLAARLMFVPLLLASAVDKFRGDLREVSMIAALGLPAPANLERLTGVCLVAASAMLALGLGMRIAAMLLIVFLAGITLTWLRYWTFDGPPEGRQSQRNGWYGNWAAVGGLIALTVAGSGAIALAPSW